MGKQITKIFNVRSFKISDLIKNTLGIRLGDDPNYDWDSLDDSLRKDGYAPEKYSYIEICDVSYDQGFKYDYALIDGNHRLSSLIRLYGEDLYIRVKVEEINTIDGKKFLKPDGDDKLCPSCFESLKGCGCKLHKADDGFQVHEKCLKKYNDKRKETILLLKQKQEELMNKNK